MFRAIILICFLVLSNAALAQLPLPEVREELRHKGRVLRMVITEDRTLEKCQEVYGPVPSFRGARALLENIISKGKTIFTAGERKDIETGQI